MKHAFIDIDKFTMCSRCGRSVQYLDEECHSTCAAFHFPIAIRIEDGADGRDWENSIIAYNVASAVSWAIGACDLKAGELLHEIHIGPPRPERP